MDNQRNPFQNQLWSLISKKLSQEATPEELDELQTVLLNNPDLHHQVDMLIEMWQQQEKPGNPESEAAYVRHIMKHKDEFFNEENNDLAVSTPMPEEERHSFFSRKKLTILSFATITIIATVLVFVFNKKSSGGQTSQPVLSSVVTKNGNRTKIVLPDGSQVWLNAGSNLDYNNSVFNKELREVSLTGEAYFDVTKNPEKPFIIHTKKMDIKVIGTAFNVRSYNEEKIAEASLIRGSIEVTLKDRNQKIILKPNEKISVANGEHLQVVSKPIKNSISKTKEVIIPQFVVKDLKANPIYNIIPEVAWTQNKLYFEDESLENVSLLLERWFGKKVIIQNERLKNVRYTGNYEKEELEVVLSSLKLSKPFNYRIDNDAVIIY